MTTHKKWIKAEEGPDNSVIYHDEEYEKLLDAMKKHEGWREGREEYTEVKKVLGVHLKKHIVSEFLIGDSAGNEWISKKDAIALAQAGTIVCLLSGWFCCGYVCWITVVCRWDSDCKSLDSRLRWFESKREPKVWLTLGLEAEVPCKARAQAGATGVQPPPKT